MKNRDSDNFIGVVGVLLVMMAITLVFVVILTTDTQRYSITHNDGGTQVTEFRIHPSLESNASDEVVATYKWGEDSN